MDEWDSAVPIKYASLLAKREYVMLWAVKLDGAVAAAETLDLKGHTPKGTEGHGSKN